MNKTFRIVWSAARNAFIVTHERANSHGKPSSTRTTLATGLVGTLLAASGYALAAPAVNQLPTGGQIVGGAAAGTIASSGNAMTVTQNQQRMVANWDTFSVGASASVHFQQPGGGVALNRVITSNPSEIFGRLTSTGTVMLVNPNGVLFGPNASVDVGALVATTMRINDGDFMAGRYAFTGGNGRVINQGRLTAAQQGYIALLAPEVRNEGVITASLGSVVLGAAEAVTLSHDSTGIQYAVDKGAVQALVENKGLVQVDGGQVVLTARAANALANAAINNSGTIEAKGLVAKGGKIVLEADAITLASGSKLDASGQTGGGEVYVGGGWQGSGGIHQATTVTMEQDATIDVSATKVGAGGTAVLWSDVHKDGGSTTVAGSIAAEGAGGGLGGQVETSGHHLSIADTASVKIDGGQWLLDPYDFTIGTDITGAALGTALASGNVSITTTNTDATCTGATCGAGSSGNGDIIFNDAVSWSANRLTLSAYRHVDVNSVLGVSGTGALTVTTNTGAAQYSATGVEGYLRTKQTRSGTGGADTFTGKINWTSTGSLIINSETYTKITDAAGLDALSTSGASSGKYFLANDITLSGTWTPRWNLTGKLEGLGHTISGLSVNQTSNPAGLFVYASTGALLQNIGLVNSSVTSTGSSVGSFVGSINTGSTTDQVTMRNLFVGAGSTVTGNADGIGDLGGLVGKHTQNYGTLRLVDSYNAASVNAGATGTYKLYRTGGLLGSASRYTYIANSYNVGEIVSGSVANKNDPSLLGDGAGGLVGSLSLMDLGVSGNYYLLKLKNYGNIYGNSNVGGIVGIYNISETTTNTAAAIPKNLTNYGNVKGSLSVGGIAGYFTTSNKSLIAELNYVTNSGAVEATSTSASGAPAGGIVGQTYANFTATSAFTGGIRISNAFNTGTVTSLTQAGGLVGYNGGYFYNGTGTYSLFELKHVFNAGGVSASGTGATTYAGGLIGATEATMPLLTDVYNRGGVTSACSAGSRCVGAIIGNYILDPITGFSSILPSANSVYSVTGLVANDNWIGDVKFGGTRYLDISAATPTGSTVSPSISWGASNPTPVTDKSPAEMQAATLTDLGFDATYWNSGTTSEYPYLQGFTSPLTITFLRDTSKTYGSANPSLGLNTDYTLTGCTGCTTLSFNTSTLGQYANAGNYLYSTSNLFSLSGDTSAYDISYAGTSYKMVVNPATLTVSGMAINNKTYTGTNAATFSSTGSLSGILNSDDVSINSGTTTATFNSVNVANAIGVTTSYALAGTKAGNYTVTNPTGLSANITQAPLTITALNRNNTYGSTLALGTLHFSATGLQNSESIAGVTLTANGGTAATDNAGSYTITPSAATGGSFSASNYSITYATGTLTNNPAAINLRATAQSKTYGATLDLGTTAYTIGSGSLKNSDTITGLTLSSPGAVDTAVVGSYTITPSAATGTGGFNTTNYSISYSNHTLTVNKAPLTITAANASKTYDGNAYSGGNGVSYSGFVLGQDQTVLGGALSYAGTAQGASNAGSYSITPQGYTSGNYAFNYVNGTLTIDKKTVSLSAAKTYDGNTTLGVGTVTIGTGISGQSLTYSGATSFSKNVADNPSNYIAALTLENGTGGLAGNYQLPTLNAANAPVTISKKDVSVTSIDIADKVYDGTTNASSVQSTVLSGVVAGDVANVNTSGTLAAFPSKDVGSYSISVTGLSLTGSEANNYNLTGGTTATDAAVAITAKPLTLTGSKTYDGTTSLTGFITLGGLIGIETLTVSSATANNSHVATANKYVSAITLANGTNGGVTTNYSLPALSYHATNNSVSIGTATLTPTLTNAGVTKVYDGADTSSFTPTWSFSGLASGDTAATLAYTGRNYNSQDVLTANTITVSGLSISGIIGSNSSAASDYVLDATSKTVGGAITAKPLTVTGLAASNKTYNALTDVTITNWGSVTTGVGTETLVLNHGTASFSDKTVNTGKTVTASGYSLADGTNGGVTSNYSLTSTSATTTADITAKTLTLSGSTGVTKTYDGRTSMPLGSNGYQSLVGVESGDTVTIAGAPAFSSANQGARTILQNTVGILGTDAGNYSLSWTNGSGTINPASLTITANNDAKFVTQADVATYNGVSYSGFVNGETTAVLGLGGLSFARTNFGTNAAGTYAGVIQPSGITANNGNYSITYVNGDYTIVPANQLLVRVTNASTTYGTGPTYNIASAAYLASDNSTIVDLSGSVAQSGSGNSSVVITDGASGAANFTLGPGSPQNSAAGWLKSGNYSIGASGITESSANFSNTLTVVGALAVNQKALTASATGVTKIYDGNTTMTNVSLGLAGLVGSDVVTVTGNGNFADKNAGTGKTYTVSSVTLASTDAANYYLSGGDSFSGNDGAIAKKTVSLAATKTYNGSTTLGAGTVTISGLIGSERLTYSAATANSKDVATASYVNALTLGDGTNGGLASNYQLPSLAAAGSGNSASITAKALTVSGITASDKTYDGSSAATVSTAGAQYAGLVSGDQFSVSATGLFNNKNVANGKTVTLSSSYSGADVGNYTITDQASTTANVTPKALTISGITASNKVYDGNVVATVSTANAMYTGLVANDVLSVSATGLFNNKNVANGKTVTLSSSYSGADVGNYTITDQATTTANITPKELTISGITAANKVYDGNAVATVSTANAMYTGLVANDVLSVSATGLFNNKNADNGKTVTLSSSYSGADVGNYTITDQATTTANVTPKTLATTATASNKMQNGNTKATVTLSNVVLGLVGNEGLVYTATGNFADFNVGVNKDVTVTVALADGVNGGLASNYQMNSFTVKADITAIPTPVPPLPLPIPTTPTPPPVVPKDIPTTPTPAVPSAPVAGPSAPAPNSVTGTASGPAEPVPGPTTGPKGPTTGSEAPIDVPLRGTGVVPVTTSTSGGTAGVVGATALSSSAGAGSSSNSSTRTDGGGGEGSGFVSVRTFDAVSVPKGSMFSFALPKDTFKHADPKTNVVLEAKTADGKPLPEWLSFDPGTGRFTGRPPEGVAGLTAIVVARDSLGGEASTKVDLRFDGGGTGKVK